MITARKASVGVRVRVRVRVIGLGAHALVQIRDAAARANAGVWLRPGAHPGSLGERNARNAPCPKPALCPAQWRTARPARSHRLRSARNATRRPGGVGLSCWAIACGGGPPPKACKSCTGCACASGCGATMALWHGSVATDRRPARRPPSVKYVSHRNGAAASPPDTRTARRGPHAGAPAREGALLVCFTRG